MPITRRDIGAGLILLTCLSLPACVQSTRATPKATPTPTTAAAGPLTDANIAAIVVAANNADISYAELAVARGVDPQVTRFARLMMGDHGALDGVLIPGAQNGEVRQRLVATRPTVEAHLRLAERIRGELKK